MSPEYYRFEFILIYSLCLAHQDQCCQAWFGWLGNEHTAQHCSWTITRRSWKCQSNVRI